MKKHVLIILRRCAKKGPVFQTYNILRYLNDPEIEPVFMTIKKEEKDDSILDLFSSLGIHIKVVEGSMMDLVMGIILCKGKIVNAIKEVAPDVIHTTGVAVDAVAQAYANKNDCRHIITVRNYVYGDYLTRFGTVKGAILANLHLFLIGRSKEVFACSESLSKIYKQNHGLLMPFIRNGVNLNKYDYRLREKKSELRKKFNWDATKNIIITSAQIIPRKNIEESIQGFLQSEISADSLFVILGDGPDLSRLREKYCNDKGIRFEGKVDGVAERLAAADIFISSSKSEGLPNSVIEAMAMQLPVILSDIPQHIEIHNLDTRIGWVYSLGNINEIKLIFDALSNEEMLRAGLFARNLAETAFSAERMSYEYSEAYAQDHI